VRLSTRSVSLVAAAGLLLTGCSGGGGDEPAPGAGAEGSASESGEPDPPVVPGMVVMVSDADLSAPVDRLGGAVSDIGTVTATVDHAAAAQDAGLELDPTVLVIGSGPQAVSPVVQAAQVAALDLPQRYLVWETDGVVYLGYNSVEWLAQQAGIDRRSDSLDSLRYGSEAVAAAATGAEPTQEVDLAEEDEVRETVVASDADVAETVRRLQAAAEEAGLSSPATVDLAAQADRIGTDVRATTVTFVGDPEAGTPLLAQAQTMGLDLPLRFLVTEAEDGTVEVTYPDVADLAARHGVDDQDAIAALTDVQQTLTAAATGT